MRIRITFGKQGALRYTGNLDLHKLWERSARRAGLALAYSQGFHPQPKIQLAAALPLGFSSRCELVDMRVSGAVELAALPERLQRAAPPGLKILKVEEIAESSPPLQTQIIAAEYEVTFYDEFDEDQLSQSIAAVLAAGTLPRERRGKPYDLRPLIEDLRQIPPAAIHPFPQPGAGAFPETQRGNGGITEGLFMRLAARESATGRPEEVLSALGVEYEGTRVERTKFIFRE
jgi:radical SAM-linked protein